MYDFYNFAKFKEKSKKSGYYYFKKIFETKIIKNRKYMHGKYMSKSMQAQQIAAAAAIHSTNPNGTIGHKSRNRPNEMGQQLKIEDNKIKKYTTKEKMIH